MKVFSLFRGVGGFDLAFKNHGYEIVGACEIDKYANQVCAKRFPGIPLWLDATKINPEELPDFDCLCAGFPCPTFSIAGKRLGLEEPRGRLFFEIIRIARQKRPRLLLLENVKGLLSHDNGRTFAIFLSALDELGYDAQWKVLNSLHHIPQNRERIFIIANLRGTPRPQIFPIPKSSQINVGALEEAQVEGERLRGAYTGTIDSNYAKGGARTMILMTGHNTQNGKKVEVHHTFALTTLKEQVVYDEQRFRMITPLECERLQGFPDGWTEGLSDTQRYRCMGNAVTVPVVEFIVSKL